jgi:hypothetical protein
MRSVDHSRVIAHTEEARPNQCHHFHWEPLVAVERSAFVVRPSFSSPLALLKSPFLTGTSWAVEILCLRSAS